MDYNAIKPFLRLLIAPSAGNVFTLKQLNLFAPLKLKDIKTSYSDYIGIVDREIVKSRAPTLKIILDGVPLRLLSLDGEKDKETVDLRKNFFFFTKKAFDDTQKYLEKNVISNGLVTMRKFYQINKDTIVTEIARTSLFVASIFGERFKLILDRSLVEHILWGVPFSTDRIVIPDGIIINKNKELLFLFMAKGIGDNLIAVSQDIRRAGFKTAIWPLNVGIFRSKRYGEFLTAFDFMVMFQINKTIEPTIINNKTLKIHTGPFYEKNEEKNR